MYEMPFYINIGYRKFEKKIVVNSAFADGICNLAPWCDLY